MKGALKFLGCMFLGHKWERIGGIVDFTYVEVIYGCRRCGLSTTKREESDGKG